MLRLEKDVNKISTNETYSHFIDCRLSNLLDFREGMLVGIPM